MKIKELIQVCWKLNELKTREREINGLIKGLEELKLDKGLIITEEQEGIEYIKNKKIKFIPLYKWLLIK